MKEAFIKYNLDKVVFSRSPSPTSTDGKRMSPLGNITTAGLNASSDQVLTGSRKSNTLQEAIYIKNQKMDISQENLKSEKSRKSRSSSKFLKKPGEKKDYQSVSKFSGVENSRNSKTTKTASLRISQRFEGQTVS